MAAPTKKLRDDRLYIAHGGEITCGAHAGTTALYTGRSIGGSKLMWVSPEVAAEFRRLSGHEPRCERPGCTVCA